MTAPIPEATSLDVLWFCVIAVFWLGYLFLEGFDFGVGMLLGVLGRNGTERRVLVNTIGPVWDGNEVWVIVAIAATFAAFPSWYASLLSGSYLVILVILLCLIGRGVAFEYRGKVDSERWRANWDRVIQVASWLVPLGWGLVITATVTGLPLDSNGDLHGGPLQLFRLDTVLGALALTGFSLVHGASFLALKTEGEVRERARRLVLRFGPIALLPLVALLFVVHFREGAGWTWVPLAVAVLAAAGALWRLAGGREGQAFALLGVVIAAAVVTLFGSLYPDVLPSTADPANSLTVAATASSPYTLSVMTWVAAISAPAVLVYQGWTYWVFRTRIGTRHIPPVHVP